MADTEQMKKIVPFVMCEITFGQNVCELMSGLNVTDLDLAFDNHFDHCLIVLKDIQHRAGIRMRCIWWNVINVCWNDVGVLDWDGVMRNRGPFERNRVSPDRTSCFHRENKIFLITLSSILTPCFVHASSPSIPRLVHVGFSLAREVHWKLPQDLTDLKFKNRSRTTRSRFLKSFALPDNCSTPAILRETAEGTSNQMVRLVFRHFAAASTRGFHDFALLRHISRFAAC